MKKLKWYIGRNKTSNKNIAFTSIKIPTEKKCEYRMVIGPFKTKRAALWAEKYGDNNPHFQTVADAERISKEVNFRYTKRKHEVIHGHRLSIWQCKNYFDEYTIVYLDEIDHERYTANYLAMSCNPFHPQGFCQHGDMPLNAVQYKGRNGAFDKRIKFMDLPEDCRKAVLQDLEND